MKRAAEALGAVFIEDDRHLVIDGSSSLSKKSGDISLIDAGGSALVARAFAVLGTLSPVPLIITGDSILRGREMSALFDALNKKRRAIEYLAEPYCLPVLVRGGGLCGGDYELPGDVSSQFITALLIAAPLADSPMRITVRDPVLSRPYISQTVVAMEKAGIHVECENTLKSFRVPLGKYQQFSQSISGDYTSASYFLAAAALSTGRTVLKDIRQDSLQGEKAVVNVLTELGVKCEFDSLTDSLFVENHRRSLEGKYEVDVRDCPNIVPTLAALGSFVDGVFKVRGASITRLHKSSRVEAMVSELRKLGVDISVIYRSGVVDGFDVRGRQSYEGGQVLSSWRDHRIFMSLFVASLRHHNPNCIDGYADVDCSFPSFFEQFAHNGAEFQIAAERADGGISVEPVVHQFLPAARAQRTHQ